MQVFDELFLKTKKEARGRLLASFFINKRGRLLLFISNIIVTELNFMSTENLKLLINIIRTERKVLKLMDKSTKEHTLKKVMFTLYLMKQSNIKYSLYNFIDDDTFNKLAVWSLKRTFNFNF